MMFYEHDMIG